LDAYKLLDVVLGGSDSFLDFECLSLVNGQYSLGGLLCNCKISFGWTDCNEGYALGATNSWYNALILLADIVYDYIVARRIDNPAFIEEHNVESEVRFDSEYGSNYKTL